VVAKFLISAYDGAEEFHSSGFHDIHPEVGIVHPVLYVHDIHTKQENWL
jgi:hypothetical protein